MKRMLVTTDGSPESEVIIPIAAELARAMAAEAHLLRVQEVPEMIGVQRRRLTDLDYYRHPEALRGAAPVESRQPAEFRDQTFERAEREASEYLEDLAKSFTGVLVQCHVLFDGDAADAIIDLAKELEVDLIAMSTHGRGALAAVVQGSVASKVVRSGVAPVLLARPQALRA